MCVCVCVYIYIYIPRADPAGILAAGPSASRIDREAPSPAQSPQIAA